MKIDIFDTTLREGAQSAGISYTMSDRVRMIHALDSLGVSYIEAGAYTENSHAYALPSLCGSLRCAKLAAFMPTCRPGCRADEDPALRAAARSGFPVITLVGKASAFQVSDVLCTDRSENLRMIRDSVSFLSGCGKEVFFDAEHFFDGYSDDPLYALSAVDTAFSAGAAAVVLCDTSGGMLPDVIAMATEAAAARFPGRRLGIHCHNDLGMAVSATVSAALSGVCCVQGTVGGVGERCGNADLLTLIPLLQLKLGFSCIPAEALRTLTQRGREMCEIMNIPFCEHAPFVGGYAFSHKAGMHIDAVSKSGRSFEHIEPDAVGNSRSFLISEQAGHAAVYEKMRPLLGTLRKDGPEVAAALDEIRRREEKGFQYEGAEASLELVLRASLGLSRSFFELRTFNVMINAPQSMDPGSKCCAVIKVSVGGRESLSGAEGDGPVNALDGALRSALSAFYPVISKIRLTDYKVRVLDSAKATASVVRVVIESGDGNTVWRTVGVSHDIIDASWQALRDSVEYYLTMQEQE